MQLYKPNNYLKGKINTTNNLLLAYLIDMYIFVTFVPFFGVQCQILRFICTNISETNL